MIKRPAADRTVAALRTLDRSAMDCGRAWVRVIVNAFRRQISGPQERSFDTAYYPILGSGFPICAGDSCLLMILGSSCGD